MKNKYLSITLGIFALAILFSSCRKEPNPTNVDSDDKSKIDIKGSLMGGDMKSPNLKAEFKDKTLWVTFYEDLDDCIVSVANMQDSVIFCDTVQTYPHAATHFYMGDQPMARYRLHITNGTQGAEGWFSNFKIVAHKPKS